MPLRITGMNSGLDTETIVRELVKAERSKVDTMKKSRTKLEWKQDAWKALNTKMKNLFNKTISNMRWANTYMKKSTTVSNSSAVSVITGEGAVNGVQKLEIVNQAKTGKLTGAQLSKKQTYTALSKLNDILPDGAKMAEGESGVINITSGGKITAISVNGDTSISDVLTQMKSAGVNASFDEKNQRIFISAKESGEDNDFALTASDAVGQKALETLGLNISLKDDVAALKEYEEYAGYYVAGDRNATLANMSGLIQTKIDERAAAYKKSNETIEDSLKKIDSKIEELKNKDDYVDGETEEQVQSRIDSLKADIEAETDEEAKKTKQEELTKLESHLSDVKQLASQTEEKSKLEAQRDENNNYINEDGTAKDKLTKEVEDAFYNKAEYANTVYNAYDPDAPAEKTGATRVAGADAKIKLDGADFTSTNNVFEVNGLTLTILSDTTEPITVTTQDDTQGIYDMIKGFLKEYNTLINEMDKLYNADVSKYEPLTDDEKEEMSESEIEKWETKVKDSLLRRDTSLGSARDTMVNIMMAGVEVNGQKMFLSSFGISTLGYFESADNEKHAYHIDGDPDDDNTSGKTDKLKSMIASDPKTVSDFFMGLAKNLSDAWSKMSSSNDMRSFGSVYNDKLLKQQYDEYESKISKQEEKVTALEEKWYKKFSAMESALAKLQSNQSAVSALLGG